MARDNDGNPVLPVLHSLFVLEDAVKQFKVFVSDDVNLLDAKLVSPLFSVIYFLVCCISFYRYFWNSGPSATCRKNFSFHFCFFDVNRL